MTTLKFKANKCSLVWQQDRWWSEQVADTKLSGESNLCDLRSRHAWSWTSETCDATCRSE